MSEAKYQGFAFATKAGIAPQASAGTVNGTGFDRLTYDHMVATLHSGSFAGTSLDVRVQDSADNSTGWANLTPNKIFDNNNQSVTYAAFPQMTTTGIDKLDVDLMAAKRYIRFVGVAAGGSVTFSVDALLNERHGTIPGATA